MSIFWALVKRDLTLAMRQGGGIGLAIGFFLVVITLLPLGLGPDSTQLSKIAPGAIWVALLLAVLLSVDRIFQPDYEDGSLELLLLGPLSAEMIVMAKTLAHWLTTGLPLVIAAPVLGVLLNLKPEGFGALMLTVLIGTPALSFIGAIGAAITVGIRRGGLLLSILVLPLYVPVLIFGVLASNAAVGVGEALMPPILVLSALSLAALVLAPVAASAALRVHFR
jgi:heme exporter protein B